jgi:hypothetical protein
VELAIRSSAKRNEEFEGVEGLHRSTGLPAASEVYYEAAGRLQHTPKLIGEGLKPADIGVLALVSVVLLIEQGEWRRCHDEIYRVGLADFGQVCR